MKDSILGQMNQYIDSYAIPWTTRILLAVLILYIGRMVARMLIKLLKRVLQQSDVDEMLIKFLSDMAYALLLVAVVIAALDQLGINTTSLLAILGAAGLAIGLALKDSLSNFAAGVMLIMFRPFKTGDYIEAGGTSGTVDQVNIFNTVLRTGDNREITIPNSGIYGGMITNYSARSTRRIDLVIGIGYDDDLSKARDLITAAIAGDQRILKHPEPAISLAELADSSVNLNVRPWVNSSDYWDVRSLLLENIKHAFDKNGISFPYPQQDIHMHQIKQAGEANA